MRNSLSKNCRLSLIMFFTLVSGAVSGQALTPLRHVLGIGAYYSEGEYGEADETEILYFPLSYEVNSRNWGFQLLVPRLEVTGLGNVLVNVGGVTRAVAGTQRATAKGLGDAVASVTYRLEPFAENAPFIDFRLDVKLPTADESKSLGTGETDYSLQLDLSQNVGNAALFATIGYNRRGKSKLYPGLMDSTFAQLGFAFPVSDHLSAGIFYDYRGAASEFSEESHELVPYFSWQFNQKWSFTGLMTQGFTDASADYSVMGQLNYRW